MEDFRRIYEGDYEEYRAENLIREFRNIEFGDFLDSMNETESDDRTYGDHLAEKIKKQIKIKNNLHNVNLLYNYIQNFEKYNKIIFRNIVKNVNKYSTKIYLNFEEYLSEEITETLFIYVLLKWFEELNNVSGMFAYDIQDILDTDGESFSFTDTSPKSLILKKVKEYI